MNMTQNIQNAGSVLNTDVRLQAQLRHLHERLQCLERDNTEQDLRIHSLENEVQSLRRRLMGGST